MNDPFDPGLLGGREQSQRVRDGVRLLERRVIEPDPIGVVQDGYVAEGIHQAIRNIKQKWNGADAVAERIGARRGIRQRDNGPSLGQQSLRNVPAGIAERTSDGMD
jgi:hypothetical protein